MTLTNIDLEKGKMIKEYLCINPKCNIDDLLKLDLSANDLIKIVINIPDLKNKFIFRVKNNILLMYRNKKEFRNAKGILLYNFTEDKQNKFMWNKEIEL